MPICAEVFYSERALMTETATLKRHMHSGSKHATNLTYATVILYITVHLVKQKNPRKRTTSSSSSIPTLLVRHVYSSTGNRYEHR